LEETTNVNGKKESFDKKIGRFGKPDLNKNIQNFVDFQTMLNELRNEVTRLKVEFRNSSVTDLGVLNERVSSLEDGVNDLKHQLDDIGRQNRQTAVGFENSISELTRCQFHQHYTYKFFIRTLII